MLQEINEITYIEIPEDPWRCLFHRVRMPIKHYLRTLVPHLMNAAKSLIPQQWQEKESSRVGIWCRKVDEIYNTEYLRFCEEEGIERFESKWKIWREFKNQGDI